MKKLFALFLTFSLLSINSCLAFSELYYVKNTNVSTWDYAIKSAFADQNYTITKENPYYGTSQYYANDYAIVIMQQSGNNVLYYYNSNDNKKINKTILKQMRRSNVDYERALDGNTMSVYDKIAQKMISSGGTSTGDYTFSDYEPQSAYSNNYSSNTNNQAVQQSNTLKGYVARVESGTKLNVYLQGAINTSTAVEGDRVIAVLTQDLKCNGATVAPQRSLLYGILTKARHAQYGSRNGKVTIDFNQIVTPDGKTYDISTEKIDFSVTNDGKIGEVASNAVVGAAVGALAGLLIGALTSQGIGTAAAIGAGVGAGGALITGAAEKGVDAEIPSFTELEVTLTKSFNATIY
jgi:hypothetical protein